MTAFTGNILLSLGCLASLLLVVQPFALSHVNRPLHSRICGLLSAIQLLGLAGAFAALLYGMVSLDLSLLYVQEHNSIRLPLIYRITGTWGGHEGSLLLWITIFSGWNLFFWLTSQTLNQKLRLLTQAVSALICLGFLFILFLKPPFAAVTGVGIPDDGRGLNPLLQDIGLAIHPPALYCGYGGISLVFSLIMAALWLKLPMRSWCQEVRKRALLSWGWLTLGIALGSWWAYRELGWGGWWFWDPVENASFMPWLALTALLHALILHRRNLRSGKTIVGLIVLSQALMIIGMFIVRSGILSSVHSFTSAPALGFSIISFVLFVAVAGYISLITNPPNEAESNSSYQWQDFIIASVIILLLLACCTVLLGTMYPLIVDVLNLGKISVGAGYFNTFIVPLILVAGALLVFSHFFKQKRHFVVWLATSTSLALLMNNLVIRHFDALAVTALTIAFLVFISGLKDLLKRGFRTGNLAHIGLALAIVGGTLSERGSQISETRLWPGHPVALGDYVFEFSGTTPVIGPNYYSDYAFFDISRDSQTIASIHPEKRLYPYFGLVLAETDQHQSFLQDFYIALGEPFGDGSWAARLKIIPFISLLWIGAFLMVIGCFRISHRVLYPIVHRVTGPVRTLINALPNIARSGERV